MVDAAEKLLSDLRSRVCSLETDVRELTSLNAGSMEYDQKTKTIAELITQALVSIDSLHISKEAAAQAIREGDRVKSRRLAVLLARRKNVVKKLNALGDEVDKLTAKSVGSDSNNPGAEEKCIR